MKRLVVFDPEKCCACHACTVACIDQNDTAVTHGEEPLRKAFNVELSLNGELRCVFLSAACMHCDDAPCVLACPVGCLKKDTETGMTVYDNTHCIGCRSCGMACPFGAPRYLPDGRMVKCDGCYMRIKNGMDPACVRACAFGALTCMTAEEYTKATAGGKAMNAMLRTLSVWK